MTSDTAALEDLRQRVERGEDAVTLNGLRSLVAMSGKDLTMKDIRAILRVPEPKQTQQQWAVRMVILGVCSALVYSVATNGDIWIAFGGIIAALWLAYSIGEKSGGKLVP